MTDTWATLAQDYAGNRIGYAPEVYATLLQFGARPRGSVLDVACGTGLACAPLAAGGFEITGIDASEAMLEYAKAALPQAEFVQGSAESLPFPADRFDLVISAQAYHWFDRAIALSEAHRVLKPGGVIGIWWKHLAAQDPIAKMREDALAELGKTASPGGLSEGFEEFYAAPFVNQTLRIIPWRTSVDCDRYIGYERSRCNVRQEAGADAERYFEILESRIAQLYGGGNPAIPLNYVHFLYAAKKR